MTEHTTTEHAAIPVHLYYVQVRDRSTSPTPSESSASSESSEPNELYEDRHEAEKIRQEHSNAVIIHVISDAMKGHCRLRRVRKGKYECDEAIPQGAIMSVGPLPGVALDIDSDLSSDSGTDSD